MSRITFLTPRGELTPDLVRDAIHIAGYEVDLQEMIHWTKIDLLVVYDWSMREHLSAGDVSIRRRPRPALLANAKLITFEGLWPEKLIT